ncbi:MAG: D-hexose-6-phosphate mutarotase [Gallionellaceae bacterium]|jgi:D-hexose-6-phosphate mutarotase|nr:D-hexose-6-phosphate mutarotase [Gallionellaceae bacterium]
MATVQELNTQFGINRQLVFREDASGLIVAEIGNAQANATLCLQGAHLMTWQPKNQAVPVVWLSRDARLAEGKSIRGGVPVCWPWFGAHASDASLPAHGFARTVPWEVVETGAEANGATRLSLRLLASAKTRAQWPHQAQLVLKVVVGETLRMELTTENTGTSDFVISEALHTYFRIGDIGSVRVAGLSGREFWDKVGGSTLRKQQGAISFSAETDRVYIDTAEECVIEDEQLNRHIHIAKSGSLSTVVWTPWIEKAGRMGDMGQPDGWREMLCIESANAFDNAVKVPAGTRHTLSIEYRVESL